MTCHSPRSDQGMAKTFDVPDSIPLSKVKAFLADLGVDDTGLLEFHCGMGGVYAELYAHNESGHKYLNPDGKTVATHRIAIPLDRDA